MELSHDQRNLNERFRDFLFAKSLLVDDGTEDHGELTVSNLVVDLDAMNFQMDSLLSVHKFHFEPEAWFAVATEVLRLRGCYLHFVEIQSVPSHRAVRRIRGSDGFCNVHVFLVFDLDLNG